MNPRQNKISGEYLGRLIIKDLALIHKHDREGQTYQGLTNEEKFELVNALTEAEDVAAYNEYRYFHELLSRASLFFNLHLQSAEARYWRILRALEGLKQAEQENIYCLTMLPCIMTQAQYEQNRSLFNPSGSHNFGRGVALIEQDAFPGNTYKIDKNGQYQYPVPQWRLTRMAENFLKSSDEVNELFSAYQATVKEALVIKTAVEIIGSFLKVPELNHLLGEVDLSQVEYLNKLMAEIPKLVFRRNATSGEETDEQLREALKNLLLPFNLRTLKPSAKAKAKARRAMDFSIALGNSEKIYSILREDN